MNRLTTPEVYNAQMQTKPLDPRLITLGANIRKARKALDMSQMDLGAAAGVHYKHVSQIECGNKNPQALTLANLAAACDVPVGSFFGE